MLTREDLNELMAAEASPAVSLFLPTHLTMPLSRQDPIRLRNLLDEAERRLMELGLRRSDALDEAELHRRAWELVEPEFARAQAEALEHFRSLFGVGDPRGVTRIEDIVRSAGTGRVDTLILAQGACLWGRHDEAADRIEAHGLQKEGDQDLLDLAAVRALMQGGSVHIVGQDKLPQGALAAAVLRF